MTGAAAEADPRQSGERSPRKKESEAMVSGIILAGGSSTRYGTGGNKTLAKLCGRPVLEYSLRVFLQ